MFDTMRGGMDFIGDRVMPPVMDERPLAMAYVRNQTELDPMDVDSAFNTGTLFRQLDKPWGYEK